MSLLNHIANGLGTLLGVLVQTTAQVIASIKTSYDAYRGGGGATQKAGKQATDLLKDELRAINDEIMELRHRAMSRQGLSDAERKRWEHLRSERDARKAATDHGREVRAAEKIIESENRIEKVEIDLETTHVLQYNAFADILGKKCPQCSRQMKLQWKKDLKTATPNDFFWGCTGWYVERNGRHACDHSEPLKRNDYGLMMDTSEPEFSMTSEEFSMILSDPGTEKLVVERVDDLRSDLSAARRGVEIATCPVHGENMVLKRKTKAAGLLDTYFLACPHWRADEAGCTFIEKLKSGSQLAALLKSETGRGVL